MKKSKALGVFMLAGTLLTGCASVDPQTGVRKDPLEGFNRAMWKVNYDYLDPYFLRPVAKGWKDYIPQPVKTGLVNVANNLDEPASFVNYLLEGNVPVAMTHFTRFWFNSIFGLGGLIDWASKVPSLQTQEQRRFGDTLGVYGVETGPYVMLPVYGPATPRQDLGGLADYAYPMYSLIAMPWGLVKYVVQGVDKRANFLGKEQMLRQAQDSYIMSREAYFQNLNYRIHNGKLEVKKPQVLSESLLNEID